MPRLSRGTYVSTYVRTTQGVRKAACAVDNKVATVPHSIQHTASSVQHSNHSADLEQPISAPIPVSNHFRFRFCFGRNRTVYARRDRASCVRVRRRQRRSHKAPSLSVARLHTQYHEGSNEPHDAAARNVRVLGVRRAAVSCFGGYFYHLRRCANFFFFVRENSITLQGGTRPFRLLLVVGSCSLAFRAPRFRPACAARFSAMYSTQGRAGLA